jgi:L-aminopeptidase/D-esterase-like protein
VGAGTGCRVGPFRGNEYATKGGIGSASVDLGGGLVVAALVANNAVGDVLDEQGRIIAGLRTAPDSNSFADALAVMREMAHAQPPETENTVIGVVATNARLTKDEANKVAQMGQNGVARAVRPSHTPYDGDTVFTVATSEIDANAAAIGAFACEVVAEAIRNSVRFATSLAGVRAISG